MRPLKIGVVGPCASGKSTLVKSLRSYGYDAKHIAQEHSYVKDMWLRLTNPEILIYLDVSYPLTLIRRQMSWSEKEYQIQLERLRHARQHADCVIHTDCLSIDEVLKNSLEFIDNYLGQPNQSGV
jgi:hypothetical protein